MRCFERKARLLMDAGANVIVNALDFTPQFIAWAEHAQLILKQEPFAHHYWMIAGWLLPPPTMTVNTQVYQQATARKIFAILWMPATHHLLCLPSLTAQRHYGGGFIRRYRPCWPGYCGERLEAVLPARWQNMLVNYGNE